MGIDRTTLNFIYNYGKSALQKDIAVFGKHHIPQYLSESINGTILSEESDKIRNMRLAGLTPEELPPTLRPEPMDPNNMTLTQQLAYRTYRSVSNIQPDGGSQGLVVPKPSTPNTSFSVVAPYQKDDDPVVIPKKEVPVSLDTAKLAKENIKMAASHLDKNPQPPKMAVSHESPVSKGVSSGSSPASASTAAPIPVEPQNEDDPWYQDTLNWMDSNKLATAGMIGVPLALAGSYLAYKKLKNKK